MLGVMRARIGLGFLLVPALARANGSMGLGLEIWSLDSWAAYCVSMILLEAWLIGRRAKIAFPKSLLISLCANFVTGMACGPLGCCAVFLHPGSTNPNPLLNSIIVLIAFAIPSGLVESILWTRFLVSEDRWILVGWSVAVHLMTIPVGWAILMIPEHPYRGSELNAAAWRSWGLNDCSRQINTFIA